MEKLELFNVSKYYSKFRALSDVSLKLFPGEIHALMGENGAGKTTLIKVLAGVLKADQINIKIDGYNSNINSSSDSKKLGFKFIHQELNIIPYLSVAENMLLNHSYPMIYGLFINWNKLHLLAENALSELGINHINTRFKCAQLSSGDQMLVRIASCLVKDKHSIPSLYVFDEPTAALTIQESEKLFKAIENLKKKGAAILYVSHRINEVLEISDKITVLRDGKNVFSERTSLISKEKIIKEMTGRDLSESFPKRSVKLNNKLVFKIKKASTRKIKDINFEVHKGEIFGITGLANSGQSELFNMILGVDFLTKGSLSFLNKVYAPIGPKDAWIRKISFVPPERRKDALMLKMSVKSNTVVSHHSELSKFFFLANKKSENEKTSDLSSKVKLKYKNNDQSIYQLSGGNQQKVVFSRALASNPQLLLLDEPTRGVDVGAKFDIYNLIRDLSKKGCSIILNSSDLSEILGMCDRILILSEYKQKQILKNSNLSSKILLTNFYEDEVA